LCGRAYIFRAGSLEGGRPSEQLIQDGEQALALQHRLEAGQELEMKLHLPPLATPDLLLRLLHHLGEHVVDHFGLAGVGNQYHGSHEGRLQRLLDLQLQHQLEEDPAEVFVVVVVGDHERDGLHFLGPASQWRLGDAEELASDSNMQRRIVGTPALVSAIIVIVVI
jgi:hypothetical protein